MQHLSNGDCLVRYRNDSGLYRVRQLQIMICTHTHVKAKFHYAILVADRSEAGRRPAASWNLAYHLARYRFRPAANRSATRFEQVRAISTCRDSSNLVADRFEAKFHYAMLVADLVAGLQRAEIWPITQLASSELACLRPASDLSATRIA